MLRWYRDAAIAGVYQTKQGDDDAAPDWTFVTFAPDR